MRRQIESIVRSRNISMENLIVATSQQWPTSVVVTEISTKLSNYGYEKPLYSSHLSTVATIEKFQCS